jgi:hypothetical protein
VASARDPDPAHPARLPAAERSARAHASHAQERGHQAGLVQLPRPPSRPRSTSCSSRSASTASRRFTITSGRTRPWAEPIPATSIHLRLVPTSRRPSRSTRSTTRPFG